MQTVASCITSSASHCASGIQVQPASIRHRSYQQCVADFMWSSFKKQVTMPAGLRSVRHVFWLYRPCHLAQQEHFEPDDAVAVINASSTSKDTCGMVALVVRGLLRRPSLRYVHGHILLCVVASHAHMLQHNELNASCGTVTSHYERLTLRLAMSSRARSSRTAGRSLTLFGLCGALTDHRPGTHRVPHHTQTTV